MYEPFLDELKAIFLPEGTSRFCARRHHDGLDALIVVQAFSTVFENSSPAESVTGLA